MQITLYKSDEGRYLAQFERGGRPVAITDQTYADLGDLLEAVFAFKREGESAPVHVPSGDGRTAGYEFEVVGGAEGHAWRFQAPNNAVLFVSAPERFPDASDAERAAEQAKRFADACVGDKTGEPIDVEYWAGTGQPAPIGARYRIRVDRNRVVIDEPTPKGREILEAAGRTPVTQYQLYQKLRGGQTRAVALDETVDLTAPGVERFQTIELTVTDGAATAAPPRRQFRLPEDDEAFLDSLGLPWETVVDGGRQWVLIHEHPLPSGYTTPTTSMAVEVRRGYPTAPLDMAFFLPHLALSSKRAIPQTHVRHHILGKVWQRWSRHRTGANRWQPGADSLKTHLALVQAWLDKEVQR